MRPILTFILVFLAAIVLAAVLAWPVYELTTTITEASFRRVISHTTLLCGLLISLLYVTRYAGISPAILGYSPPHKGRQFLHGFIIGLGLMAVIEITLLGFGAHRLDSGFAMRFSRLAMLLLSGLATGMVVALIEETIFRGAMYAGLRQQSPLVLTIIMTSLTYAAVHYLKYPDPGPDTAVTWSTGLNALPQAVIRFSQPVYYDAMLTLFMLGVLLAMMRHFSGNLLCCIGLHTAVVMGDKTITKLTNYAPDAGFFWLTNTYDTPLGYASTGWLIVFCLAYYVYMKRKRHNA